ncbi:hypothetical protein [Hyphomicrobium sp. 99]|uniref:TlpA family protein disulfide reductase n=1 Tax=Hyphomicrobium sp. 99 TaxID=1163419 RepID=UPI000697A103|nr:hypothetical protein [Hyphomicrobium sp. 99]
MRLASIFAALIVAVLPMARPAAGAETPRTFDAATLNEIRDAHKGRPLIVHFWGLTCSNCMAELKEWGAFARAHPDATVVLVNWDQRGARPEQIGPTLQKAGLSSMQSFALGNGFEEKLRFAVSPDWMGELPYTRLIAGDGTVTAFSGLADFEELGSWLTTKRQAPR